MIRLLVYLFGVLLVSVSCVTERRCNKKFPPQVIVKDSVWTVIEREYHDTVVYAPADTVILTDTIVCDESGRVNFDEQVLRSNQARVRVSIVDSRLQVEAYCDSLELELQKIRELRRVERSYTKAEVQIKKERYVPGFYQFTFWYFLLTAGGGVVYFFGKRLIS